MILTITPNVALDRTYVVDRVELGAVHKVGEVLTHTGGKGVNVSRSIVRLGGATLATGILGAAGLDGAERELAAAGIDADLFSVTGAPRQTVTVTARNGTTTAFDEPGPTVSARDWKAFELHVGALVDRTTMAVVAGSVPPGAPDEGLARLTALATDRGVPVVLDARGEAMRAALAKVPLVAKLNRDELAETLGRASGNDEDVVRGARELLNAGARSVIVTLGPDGAIGLDGTGAWRIRHPARRGNPIGAGDAFTAGVALALLDAKPFAEALREGAAAAQASVRAPVAGELEAAHVREALPGVMAHLIGESSPDRALPAPDPYRTSTVDAGGGTGT